MTRPVPSPSPLSVGDVCRVTAKPSSWFMSEIGDVVTVLDGPDSRGDFLITSNGQWYSPGNLSFIGRPDADGWMPWSGGENPVGETLVTTLRRNDVEIEGRGSRFDWFHSPRRNDATDIIAFRLSRPASAPASSCIAKGRDVNTGRAMNVPREASAPAEPARTGGEAEIIWTQRGAGVDGDPLRVTAGLGDMTAEVLLSRGTGLWNLKGSHFDGRIGLATQTDGRDYAEAALRVRAKERVATARSCLAALSHPADQQEKMAGGVVEPVAWRYRWKPTPRSEPGEWRPPTYDRWSEEERTGFEEDILYAHPHTGGMAGAVEVARKLKETPAIEALTPAQWEWDACEVVQDRYDLMKRKVDAALAALTAAAAEGV